MRRSFRITEAAALLLAAVLLTIPRLAPVAGKIVWMSRRDACAANLKQVGVGLELWRANSEEGRYPPWDVQSFAGTGKKLNSWCEVLAMEEPFTPARIRKSGEGLKRAGLNPDDFIKCVDGTDIFNCPADDPRPHRMALERATAWCFDPPQHSYAISATAVMGRHHADGAKQVLSIDGLWTWSHNFSAGWIDNPDATVFSPRWYSNTVGYWHKGSSANLLLRDGHVENHRWDKALGLPDTQKVFFEQPGEDHDVFVLK